MTRKRREGRQGAVHVVGGWPDWPLRMVCGDCARDGWVVPDALAYPYPLFEDKGDFEDPLIVTNGSTIGTVWCPRCSPPWGAFVLEQMSILSALRFDARLTEPAVSVPGGLPVEDIAFLESELADFFDGPGPLTTLRPHWFGRGPVAPRSEAFIWACADLVAFMREARLVGVLMFGNREAAA